jgi:hypothetical protein
LGYQLTHEELDDLYHRFCAVADHRKKGLMNMEIGRLIEEGIRAKESAAD